MQPTPGLCTSVPEQLPAALRGGIEGCWLWRIEEAHEYCEHLPVRQEMQRIVESLVAFVGGIIAEDIVGLTLVSGA